MPGIEKFVYKEGSLTCEGVDISSLADDFGTPLYVYSLGGIVETFEAYQSAFSKFDPVIAYAVKANPNLSIMRELAARGSGADIVSGGELDRAVRAGVPPEKIVFAGVGKGREEMVAGLEREILMFNVESIAELKIMEEVAGSLDKQARIAIRVNPDVDPRTHAYISTGKKESKFGLDIKTALQAYQIAVESPHLDPIGLHCHIGSQITQTQPFLQAAEKVSRLVTEVRTLGVDLKWIDFGGGLGIRYSDETPPTPQDLATAVGSFLETTGCRVILEPGRSMVGESGVLITRVHYVKKTPIHNYVIVDAAMNDLARPALYGAYHEVSHVKEVSRPETKCEIVGPICETGDFLAKGRILPLPEADDLLSLGSAGAYGMAMASNYNIRPRAAEVLVHKGNSRLVTRRETYEDLLRTQLEVEDSEWR